MAVPTLDPVVVYGSWPPEPSGGGGAGGMWDWDWYWWDHDWDWFMSWDWGGYPIEDPAPPGGGPDATGAVDAPTPEAEPAPVVDPAPVPSNWGGPALESGLWYMGENDMYHYESPLYLAVPGIDRFIVEVLPGIKDYYASHYADEARHYRDPASTGGMAASVVSAVVPETSKLLKYVGQLLQSSLDEKAFNALKWMSRKNNLLIHTPDDSYYVSTTVRLEGDRTGAGKADFFIEYTNYLNPSNYNEQHFAQLIGNIYPFLDDENFFFG